MGDRDRARLVDSFWLLNSPSGRRRGRGPAEDNEERSSSSVPGSENPWYYMVLAAVELGDLLRGPAPVARNSASVAATRSSRRSPAPPGRGRRSPAEHGARGSRGSARGPDGFSPATPTSSSRASKKRGLHPAEPGSICSSSVPAEERRGELGPARSSSQRNSRRRRLRRLDVPGAPRGYVRRRNDDIKPLWGVPVSIESSNGRRKTSSKVAWAASIAHRSSRSWACASTAPTRRCRCRRSSRGPDRSGWPPPTTSTCRSARCRLRPPYAEAPRRRRAVPAPRLGKNVVSVCAGAPHARACAAGDAHRPVGGGVRDAPRRRSRPGAVPASSVMSSRSRPAPLERSDRPGRHRGVRQHVAGATPRSCWFEVMGMGRGRAAVTPVGPSTWRTSFGPARGAASGSVSH